MNALKIKKSRLKFFKKSYHRVLPINYMSNGLKLNSIAKRISNLNPKRLHSNFNYKPIYSLNWDTVIISVLIVLVLLQLCIILYLFNKSNLNAVEISRLVKDNKNLSDLLLPLQSDPTSDASHFFNSRTILIAGAVIGTI